MILDYLIIKTFKVTKEFNLKFWGTTKVEEGRIIFSAMYIGSNGMENFKMWILATATKPAFASFLFKELERASELGCLEEIDIDNLYCFNNHLNKEVRFLLRKTKISTREVLFEKYVKTKNKKISHYDSIVEARRTKALYKRRIKF